MQVNVFNTNAPVLSPSYHRSSLPLNEQMQEGSRKHEKNVVARTKCQVMWLKR